MHIILIFLLILIIIALVMIGIPMSRREHKDLDSQYINEEGDHLYYDRSLIRKKQFNRRHPDDKDFRTFRRLFRRN